MVHDSVSEKVWKRFVQEGILDSSRLSKRISESWYRCRNGSVNPFSGEGREILQGESFDRKIKKNERLLDITLSHVERLSPFLKDTQMIALLIDPDGYVLSMNGADRIMQYARGINFVEGVRWTEEEVGTNAIGTALHAREPISVIGTEHYSLASHNWSCFASPIRDENGQLLGVLDISSPVDQNHLNMLAIVTSVAYAVEHEWSRRRQQDELELLRHSLELAETNQPAVIANQNGQVVYANKYVRQMIPQWSCIHRHALKQLGYLEQKLFPIYSTSHGTLIGHCIYLMQAASISRPSISFSAKPVRFRGEAGTSQAFQGVLKEIERTSKTNVNVFIRGESGSGKELIAQAIHDNSANKDGPFVAVNCGAIPNELIESELFGYAEGAFTGSRRHGYKGKLEQANGGTLFLDEIGEIPHAMQVALLRVLQERKVTPVGSNVEVPINIRVISATHRDISQLVKEGKFREDLFYRLHVYPIYVPPLRERKEDIPHLIRYYCQKNNWDMQIAPDIMRQLTEYDWPGNIRELFNTLERMHILSDEEEIPFLLQQLLSDRTRVANQLPSADTCQQTAPVLTYRENLEKQSIIQALQKSNGSASMAANLLGIPRSTFYRKLRKFNL